MIGPQRDEGSCLSFLSYRVAESRVELVCLIPKTHVFCYPTQVIQEQAGEETAGHPRPPTGNSL